MEKSDSCASDNPRVNNVIRIFTFSLLHVLGRKTEILIMICQAVRRQPIIVNQTDGNDAEHSHKLNGTDSQFSRLSCNCDISDSKNELPFANNLCLSSPRFVQFKMTVVHLSPMVVRKALINCGHIKFVVADLIPQEV